MQPMTEAPTDPSTTGRRTSIADEVFAALVRDGLEVAQDPVAGEQLRHQVAGIVREVQDAYAGRQPDAADGPSRALSVSIGRSRARDAVHPSVSLEAASRLFEVALPLLIADARARQDGPDTSTAISRALHRSVMARVAPAAVGYVETLMEKLAIAQHEERLRLSRELHDHVAHNVAAAIQRIVLTRSTGSSGAAGAELLDVAEHLLRSALADTRSIGVELRQSVGDRTVDQAVREYVDASPTLRPLVGVQVTGLPVRLPVGSGEELYVIVREALRNAVAHARAKHVSVHFAWRAGGLRIAVVDDGGGFRLDQRPTTSMGLLAMRERAEALGAELIVASTVGTGTTVTVDLRHERFSA